MPNEHLRTGVKRLGSECLCDVSFRTCSIRPRADSGDGGNRTRVRDRAEMASTSVAGALISPRGRLAGGVPRDQPPEAVPGLAEADRPG